MEQVQVYRPAKILRFVTASSLFDGHDASISIMRRILQASGTEVIHLGHNRSVEEVVTAAVEEDADAIAVSSYQGGHMAYFQYMVDLLRRANASHIRVFGGGGGTIIPTEVNKLHAYGVAQIFTPEDGRQLGLQGMINYMLETTDKVCLGREKELNLTKVAQGNKQAIAEAISYIEEYERDKISASLEELDKSAHSSIPVLGITGTGGAGKSTLTDELIRRFLRIFPDKTIAFVSIDPTKRKTGGALLGDRIRMNAIINNRVFMRSLATRDSRNEISDATKDIISLLKTAYFDIIMIETSGIGQGDAAITTLTDLSMYVMTAEFGAPTQLEKIDMIDLADFIAINKFEQQGSEDALSHVRKQYERSHLLFQHSPEQFPIFGTIASNYNDPGVNKLFKALLLNLKDIYHWPVGQHFHFPHSKTQQTIIPTTHTNYLQEIQETIRRYHHVVDEHSKLATQLYQLSGAQKLIDDPLVHTAITEKMSTIDSRMDVTIKHLLHSWDKKKQYYAKDKMTFKVRDTAINVDLTTTSVSGLKIPRVIFPQISDWGKRVEWLMRENVPGSFPYTAGVFPFKRDNEDPTRQFAGEGTPDRTNKRFHYLSQGTSAKRLSTAFDSVTLYGEDPSEQPDLYGKIGESGVSVCTLDDMKKLYKGFDLTAPTTSVSMTINGPAPIILAMYFNTAIEQQVEKFKDNKKREPTPTEALTIQKDTLKAVRGTVQADILKEDQGQNTCIFSTEFALKLMGDMQEYFIENHIKNYYSVSISGYHIAEAGANPITQLAFTLANGFTYVEYYLSRGMDINDFAPNLSFFFSNGLDPEYTVIGRVARRIWAITMRDKYGANERSQKLKYHIQTSGRSLHAQEIDFNDIRTTLQALLAIQDNCNSLHTNSYDEAITTPTESSVRRALAIQMIINKEFGLTINENSLQGSFIVEELTDLVEEAVLVEFERINERGGVLGAMERQYQRGKIQEESLYYEHKKHTGELPMIGVNTYVNRQQGTQQSADDIELIRATSEEKKQQIKNVEAFKQVHQVNRKQALERLKKVVQEEKNIFDELMDTVKMASLGQITAVLYEVGGQYRRNM